MRKTLSRTSLLLIAVALAAMPAVSSAATFKVDANHSSVNFKIRHFVTQVQGRFERFQGTVEFDPKARDGAIKVEGTIDASSINTDMAKRDAHLRSDAFFDVAKYPTIRFSGGKLTDFNSDKTEAKLHGELTMHGVTKPLVLDVQFHGTAMTRFHELKAGLTARGTLNRKDFGIVWNKTLDSGGYMLGDTVELDVEVELTQQDEATVPAK